MDNHSKTHLTNFLVIIGALFVLVIMCNFFLKADQNSKIYHFDLNAFDLKSAEYQQDSNAISLETRTDSDYCAVTPIFLLQKGKYDIHITYSSTIDSHVLVQGSNNCVFEISLPASNGKTETITNSQMELINGTDKGKIKFYLDAPGEFLLYDVYITSEKPLYSDNLFFMILMILFVITLVLLFLIKKSKTYIKAHWLQISVFAIILLLINIPYFRGIIGFGIDTRAQLLRIEGMRAGLMEGQLPVIINPNYCNGYGELGALYPNLFLLIPGFLMLKGVTLITSYHFFMILINILTAFTMYYCAKSLSLSTKCSLFAMAAYLFEPTRLYIMLRSGNGAGRGIAMAFLPLVIVGIYHVMKGKKKSWLLLSIGMWGMFSSHILTTFLGVIYILVFVICHLKKFLLWDKIIDCLKAVLLFILMSLGSIVPFFDFYFEDWNINALKWSDFYSFQAGWAEMINDPHYRGLTLLALIAVTVITFLYRKQISAQKDDFYKYLLFSCILLFLMTLKIFPWRLFGKIAVIDSLLQIIQLGNRFHTLLSPMMALLFAWVWGFQSDGVQLHSRITIAALSAILVLGALLSYKEYYDCSVLMTNKICGDINSKPQEDYLPAGTLSEYYETDTGNYSDYESIQSLDYIKAGTLVWYSYTCSADNAYVEFPLFYYKGYQSVNQNGEPLRIEKGAHNMVRVYLEKCSDAHALFLQYKVKTIYVLSFGLSCVSTFIVFLYLGFSTYRRKSN